MDINFIVNTWVNKQRVIVLFRVSTDETRGFGFSRHSCKHLIDGEQHHMCEGCTLYPSCMIRKQWRLLLGYAINKSIGSLLLSWIRDVGSKRVSLHSLIEIDDAFSFGSRGSISSGRTRRANPSLKFYCTCNFCSFYNHFDPADAAAGSALSIYLQPPSLSWVKTPLLPLIPCLKNK